MPTLRALLPRRLFGVRTLVVLLVLGGLVYFSAYGTGNRRPRWNTDRHLEPEEKTSFVTANKEHQQHQQPLPVPVTEEAQKQEQVLQGQKLQHQGQEQQQQKPPELYTNPLAVVERLRPGSGRTDALERLKEGGDGSRFKDEAAVGKLAVPKAATSNTGSSSTAAESTGTSSNTGTKSATAERASTSTTTASSRTSSTTTTTSTKTAAKSTSSTKVESSGYTTADDYISHFKDLTLLFGMTIAEAATSCKWDSKAEVNFQYGASTEWVKHERNASETAARRELWQNFVLNETIAYESVAHHFSGRGIVICAGNERSLKRLPVLLRLLKHFKTALPIEVHHWTDKEISASNRTDLAEIFPNISFNDLSTTNQTVNTTANGFINYNLKLAALINSRFAEPLLIDSDNVPVSDPASLFKSDTYTLFGSIFWPDIARTRPQNPMWAITNTACRPDEYEQESGQLLVNKKRFWYHLQLAAWFGHQDYYKEFLLGDKDCFRFAWHALKTPYGRPTRWLTSVGMVQRPAAEAAFPANLTELDAISSGTSSLSKSKSAATDEEKEEEKKQQQAQGGPRSFYCGHSFGQHHPDGPTAPIAFLHGGLVKTLNREQISHARNHSGGFFSAYKRGKKADSNWGEVEPVGIKYDGALDYLKLREGKEELERIAQCVDMGNVVPRVVGDTGTRELRGFEEAFEEAGGFWMLEE